MSQLPFIGNHYQFSIIIIEHNYTKIWIMVATVTLYIWLLFTIRGALLSFTLKYTFNDILALDP